MLKTLNILLLVAAAHGISPRHEVFSLVNPNNNLHLYKTTKPMVAPESTTDRSVRVKTLLGDNIDISLPHANTKPTVAPESTTDRSVRVKTLLGDNIDISLPHANTKPTMAPESTTDRSVRVKTLLGDNIDISLPSAKTMKPTEATLVDESKRPADNDLSCALDDGIGECMPVYLCDNLNHTIAGVPVLEIQYSNGPCASDDNSLLCCHTQDVQKAEDAIKLEPMECILPPFPAHGTYEVLSEPKGEPGEKLQSFVLKVSCARGYSMAQLGYDKDESETQDVFCINGKWSQTFPKCVRFCKLHPHVSIRYMCSGVVCKQYVAPGTEVEPICNVYYSSESLSYMKCRAGRWNYVARCRPDCGRLTSYGLQLIIDGKTAKRGEIPWHVAIYRNNTTEFEQICGGSLVTDKLVISAAHCFWSDVKKLLPAAGFAVAVGKLYRAWDDERDFDSQKSAIQDIKVPMLFLGGAAHYQEDIAVLVLANTIVFNSFIRPVCLNFDDTFDTLQLQPDKYGKVAGWGLTAANGNPSEILKTVRMPFISAGVCVDTVPQSFRPFLTGDKFCAGYTNGTSLCRGDSGGGIAFPERQEGADRYYLRGIVSTAPVLNNQLCNDATYTTFTRIVKHEHFIKKSLVHFSSNCPSGMFQCEDNTCEERETECSES